MGLFFARAGKEKRYVQIEPEWNESDICHAVHDAPDRQGVVSRAHVGKSQTLENIPHGRAACRCHDLEEFVIGKARPRGNKMQQI